MKLNHKYIFVYMNKWVYIVICILFYKKFDSLNYSSWIFFSVHMHKKFWFESIIFSVGWKIDRMVFTIELQRISGFELVEGSLLFAFLECLSSFLYIWRTSKPSRLEFEEFCWFGASWSFWSHISVELWGLEKDL